MPRYIDADKLILSLRKCAGYEHNKHTTITWTDACESFIDEIEDLLVDDKDEVVPVAHAKLTIADDGYVRCTACGNAIRYPLASFSDIKYCPHCGAKTDEESEKDDA